jgi:hypothetical protein
MCCASLHEAVTEKNYPTLAPLCVNNPYFLYAPHFLIVPGKRANRPCEFQVSIVRSPQNVNTANKKRRANYLLALGVSRRLKPPPLLGYYLPELVALPVDCKLALGMLT